MNAENPKAHFAGWRLPIKPAVILLILLVLGLRIHLLLVRYFDADELEHLQASFLIFKGYIPYRDFFENHFPLYYYLLSPLFYPGTGIPIIFAARALSLILTIALLFPLYRLAKKLFSPPVALVSIIWLPANFIFLWRSMEIRPMIFSLFLLLLGTEALLRGIRPGGKRSAFLGGVLFCLAFLSSQKVIFFLIGALYFFIWHLILSVSSRTKPVSGPRLSPLGWLAAGFALPLVPAAAYFAASGALPACLRVNILLALGWRRRMPPAIHLKTLFFFNPFFVFWGMAGFIRATRTVFRPDREREGAGLIYFITLSGIIGLLLNPVILPQYIALFLPLVSIYAAGALLDYLRYLKKADFRGRLVGGLLLPLSGLAAPLWLKYRMGYSFPLPVEYFPVSFAVCAGLITGSYLLFLTPSGTSYRRTAYLLLAGAILIRPGWHLAAYHRSGNREQLGALRHALAITGPEDRVMDGWSGLGLFRLPAYYYHYLPEGVLLMMSGEEKGELLLTALRNRPPELIISGPYLDRLSPSVREHIRTRYRPLAPGHLFLIPIPPDEGGGAAEPSGEERRPKDRAGGEKSG